MVRRDITGFKHAGIQNHAQPSGQKTHNERGDLAPLFGAMDRSTPIQPDSTEKHIFLILRLLLPAIQKQQMVVLLWRWGEPIATENIIQRNSSRRRSGISKEARIVRQ